MDDDSLTDLLVDLIAVPSVTGDEAALCDGLTDRYRERGVRRVGDSFVAGGVRGGRPLVLLVAHLDTVPPAADDDRRARVEDGRVVGRGASDMKSGLAVAMDVFESDPSGADVLLVGYAREEGPNAENELGPLLEAVPEVRAADLAVVLEPTDLEVQLGCMGALQVDVVVQGRAAHSARPWLGRNALTAAAPLLAGLHERAPVDVTVDDLVFREVVVPTQAATDNARNVVPDRFTVNLNYRFAPDKDGDAAAGVVHELVAPVLDGVPFDLQVRDVSPPAPPRRDDPLVARFCEAAAAQVAPKQAWTDVARFAQLGIPALNYGPGLTAQAHQAGEYVPGANLPTARDALARFLDGLGSVRRS